MPTGADRDAALGRPVRAGTAAPVRFRHFDRPIATFVVILAPSGVVGAGKDAVVGHWPCGTGILFLPLSIGPATGGAKSIATRSQIVVALAPDAGWVGRRRARRRSSTRRISSAPASPPSGSASSPMPMSGRMKLATRRRWLLTGAHGSTIVGEGVDSAISYRFAFRGAAGWVPRRGPAVPFTRRALEVGREGALTPIADAIVDWPARREGFDAFDRDTGFTPFARWRHAVLQP